MKANNKKSNNLRKFCGIFSFFVAIVMCAFIVMGFIARGQTLDSTATCTYEPATDYEYNACLDHQAIITNQYTLFQQLFLTTLLAILPVYIILGLLSLKKDA